jgi:hypothetical protein
MISRDEIDAGLAFLDGLDATERGAFLGLFAGAKERWIVWKGGGLTTGKAECEWVEDWRDFYGRKLADAGLVTFREEGGSAYCSPTDLGRAVREAWWAKRARKTADLERMMKALADEMRRQNTLGAAGCSASVDDENFGADVDGFVDIEALARVALAAAEKGA